MDFDEKAAVESYLGWWADAGVETNISDEKRSWLTEGNSPQSHAEIPAKMPPFVPANAASPARAREHPARAREHPAQAAMPSASDMALAQVENVAAMDRWFAENGCSLCPEGAMRLVLPRGPAEPQVMMLSDMPDAQDLSEQRLFSGDREPLLTAMLSAIGLDFKQQRVASILLTRPHDRQLAGPARQRLIAAANHHIRVVRPQFLLLLGAQACQMMTGRDVVPMPADQPFFNHDGVKVAVFATHHPRMLIDRPQFKRHAWEILKRMKDLL